MLISNLINNNYVAAIDDDGNEVVVKGTGIGYKKSRGSYIPDSQIEKIYRIKSSSTMRDLKELLLNIPEEHFQICSDIIDYAKKELRIELNPNLYVTLADHISYAISRISQGIRIENPMLQEIKLFYPREFLVGKYAVGIVKKKLGIDLGGDEAGIIAFHIVNAEANMVMNKTTEVANLIKTTIEIIEQYFDVEFDKESVNVHRLIFHLKFLASNVLNHSREVSKSGSFSKTVKEAYPKEYECSLKIDEYIRNNYSNGLDDEELMYLTINISRVLGRT